MGDQCSNRVTVESDNTTPTPVAKTTSAITTPSPSNSIHSSQSVSPSRCFTYNPYNISCPMIYHEAPASMLPRGTLHLALEGAVTFVRYPQEQFVAPPALVTKKDMVRIFIGQLPYQVTDMQLNWLCYSFGRGSAVHFPERIMKRDDQRGCKVPTGCIHAYCDPELVDYMTRGMHKRILVDDTGVWFAQTEQEATFLNDYCKMLKADRTMRFPHRPYDTVVVQYATSSYVPPPNVPTHRGRRHIGPHHH